MLRACSRNKTPAHGIKTRSAEGEIHHFGRCRHFLARSRPGKEGGRGGARQGSCRSPRPGVRGCQGARGADSRAAAALRTEPAMPGCWWERGDAPRSRAPPRPPRCSRGMLPGPRSSSAATRTGPVDAGGRTPPAATEVETLAGAFSVAISPRIAVRALTAFGQPRPRRAPPAARSPLLSPLRRRETKTTQKQHGGTGTLLPNRPRGGRRAAARRCHWRGAGRPSPPGGGGGGGRLEAGPRGAVAPVGARRAAGSLQLQLPRRAGIREPRRGRV